MSIEELEAEIRQLPENERALLLERLGDEVPDPEVAELQRTEVRRRYQDIVEGRVQTVNGADVLKRAKAMLSENP